MISHISLFNIQYCKFGFIRAVPLHSFVVCLMLRCADSLTVCIVGQKHESLPPEPFLTCFVFGARPAVAGRGAEEEAAAGGDPQAGG